MRIALAQLSGTPGDADENLVLLQRTLQQHQGADLIVFPELYLPGYFAGREPSNAVGANDAAMLSISAAAKQHGVDVIFGFAEKRPGGVSNSVAHVDAEGELVTVYRKAQLFGEGETQAFVAGDRLAITEVRGVKVGLLNCFDVEFPEHARALSQAGAQLLVTVAANMSPYGPDHALAVRGRAVENRRPHVYVNRVGPEADLYFVGESCVVTSSGEVVAQLGADAQVVEVEVAVDHDIEHDIDYLRHLRRLPVQGHSKHER